MGLVIDKIAGVLIHDHSEYLTSASADARYLRISNNLSDLGNAATARTNLGLIAGGTGDIWVEKAGDTMTGTLDIQPSANVTRLILRKPSGNSPDMMRLYDESGNVEAYWNAFGGLYLPTNGFQIGNYQFRATGDYVRIGSATVSGQQYSFYVGDNSAPAPATVAFQGYENAYTLTLRNNGNNAYPMFGLFHSDGNNIHDFDGFGRHIQRMRANREAFIGVIPSSNSADVYRWQDENDQVIQKLEYTGDFTNNGNMFLAGQLAGLSPASRLAGARYRYTVTNTNGFNNAWLAFEDYPGGITACNAATDGMIEVDMTTFYSAGFSYPGGKMLFGFWVGFEASDITVEYYYPVGGVDTWVTGQTITGNTKLYLLSNVPGNISNYVKKVRFTFRNNSHAVWVRNISWFPNNLEFSQELQSMPRYTGYEVDLANEKINIRDSSWGVITKIEPKVANGGSALAYLFDTENTLSTSGAKIASFKNDGTEKVYIDKDGATFIADTSAAPSTPTGGGIMYVESGSLKYKGSSGTVTVLGAA